MECIRAHNRPQLTFRDILKDRHEESDFMWISREFQWAKAYKKTKEVKNPASIKGEVLRSPRILRLIEEEAKEKNISRNNVRLSVQNILEEIACSKQLPVVRWLGYALLKIMKRTVSALYVNEEKLLKLKGEMGSNPVLFLPSHRSYADFILMAFVMFNYSIDIPCVAAGMDFHSMWLMGKLLRDCSAFFMRRSFADDKLYRTVFDEYVKKLVSLGEAPVEFFIEGTRSRSAKSLMPKFGLLTMVMDTFYSGEVPDITIVPVNISYDRTLEEVLFAYEMLGIAKPKESTSGLIKGINMLDERYGSVYVDFCEPISAHQYVWDMSVGDGLIKGINMLDERYGSVYVDFCEPISAHQYVWDMSAGDVSYTNRAMDREQYQIAHLGHCIVNSQQKHAVLTCFNILALVLSNHMVAADSPLPVSKAAKDVAWLSSVLSVLGAYVKEGNTLESVKEAILVHKSLVKLNGDTIQLVSVHSPHYKIDPNRIKGHRLTDTTMEVAVPLLMLQLYVNPCMHYIISPAIITVVMQHLGDSGHITRGQLFKRYQFLRALLAHEFVLYKEWEVKEFEDALLKLELVNIIESSTEEQLTLGNHKKLQLMMCNLLYPFLSGYLSLGQFLLQTKPEPMSEKTLLQAGQAKIESDLYNGLIHSPYSLSLDMISCALSALTQLQALSRSRTTGDVKYTVLHEKLVPIVRELDELVVRPQAQGDPLQLSSKHALLDPMTARAKL